MTTQDQDASIIIKVEDGDATARGRHWAKTLIFETAGRPSATVWCGARSQWDWQGLKTSGLKSQDILRTPRKTQEASRPCARRKTPQNPRFKTPRRNEHAKTRHAFKRTQKTRQASTVKTTEDDAWADPDAAVKTPVGDCQGSRRKTQYVFLQVDGPRAQDSPRLELQDCFRQFGTGQDLSDRSSRIKLRNSPQDFKSRILKRMNDSRRLKASNSRSSRIKAPRKDQDGVKVQDSRAQDLSGIRGLRPEDNGSRRLQELAQGSRPASRFKPRSRPECKIARLSTARRDSMVQDLSGRLPRLKTSRLPSDAIKNSRKSQDPPQDFKSLKNASRRLQDSQTAQEDSSPQEIQEAKTIEDPPLGCSDLGGTLPQDARHDTRTTG
ncbi:hypothetical protein DFH09DRAFT_1481760 [Mycena vulgaris]|nr:hypothetical protein DFH09DRAFT_1481760 [Mycena vulgaris]